MTKEGHVRLKRWYEPGADREDYYDLSDEEVYYDSIGKQYKIKMNCGDCGELLGWFCYPTNEMQTLLQELFAGVYCVPCYQNENFDIDYEDCEPFEGKLCKC